MNPNNPIRLAMYGGVLFGVAVLAGIYYINTRFGGERSRPSGTPSPPQFEAVDPQTAVLRAIRARRPGEKIEIVRWWAPKPVAFKGSTMTMCRAIYRAAHPANQIWRQHDGAFDLTGPIARAVQDLPEGVETHRALDPFFPCENCVFSPEALLNAAIKKEHQLLDGVWKVDGVLLDPPGKDQWKGSRCIIKGHKVTGTLPSEKSAPVEFTIKLIDPAKPIKEVDIRPEGAKDAIPAVYLLDRDRLIVCWTPEKNIRPRTYHPRAKGDIVVAFRRE